HDGRRCDRGERAGQGLGLYVAPAGRRGALIKGLRGKCGTPTRFRTIQIRSALGLERTWTAVAGARAINNGSAIVHRPSRPEKLTLRADVKVTLPIEGKVGTRQDALFPLAHVPNRDVRL